MRLKIDRGGCLNWMLISVARSEALAGAQKKRKSGPAPVLDFEAKRGVGFGAGFGIDAVLVAVAIHALALDNAGTVLAADRVEDGNGGDGLPDFELFTADALGLEARRRLEGDRESNSIMWFWTTSRSAPAFS